MLASEPARLATFLGTLSPQEKAALEFRWEGFFARPKQLAPRWKWTIWLILAGRGFGKSRTGAEWIRDQVGPANVPSTLRIALVGRTSADVRDVMIEGESGILAVCPPWNRPKYEPSKRRLTWPNGAIATCYSADKPDQLRGPQHHIFWADELASWRFVDAWDQLQFGLRLGDYPRGVVTTTPRPTKIIRDLVGRAKHGKRKADVAITRGSTYENRGNLPAAFLDVILAKYEGTRLGRQELYAEVLDDTPGALWTRKILEACFVEKKPLELWRIVVAVDPAVTSGEDSAETGIVVEGVDQNADGYVLEDLSGKHTPGEWASVVVKAYKRWNADLIIGEVNNGGDLVEHAVRTVDANVAYRGVRAAKGKHTRAEPVSALYEQGRIKHVGAFAELEDQMCTWVPGQSESPDRLDAMVWGFTELILESPGGIGGTIFIPSGRS